MKRLSLTARVLIGSFLWISIALASSGFGILKVFEDSAFRQFDERLEAELDLLIVAITRSPEAPGQRMTSPAFARVYSGLYWQAVQQPDALFRSRSLFDQELTLTPPEAGIGRDEIAGPDGQQLRLLSRTLQTPDGASWQLGVAADLATLREELALFQRSLLVSASWITILVLAAAAIANRAALSPLRSLRSAVQQRKTVETGTIDGEFPTEIEPLVTDLNTMLQRNTRLRERGRLQAANLAHALKTPATILKNELDTAKAGGEINLTVAAEAVERVASAADQHLRNVVAGQEAMAAGSVIDVVATANEVLRALERLFPEIAFSVEAPDQLPLAMLRADQMEILGNLVENAARFANSRVVVSLSQEADEAIIAVEDDGPGIPEGDRDRALQAGVRLDQKTSGSGLGLGIVEAVVDRYEGQVSLSGSALGGLKAEARLPTTNK
ncbi:MAG: sensor histidine kinase [Alphaproteobacteria bacterium]|nr:sensor histidine kinase [Alphaproteobacteria bacterium SS10]